jgi:putative oxidoreductase
MKALVEKISVVHNTLFGHLKYLDGLAPLALRLYLVPIFWMAGMTKINGIDGIIGWFGEGGLDLPFPTVMAYLAAYTEAGGAILLALGLATRWISIPLMVTMLVAIFAVHWDHGWAAVADSSVPEIATRLDRARDILAEHSNYSWLTEKGGFVILNNGIEFAVTYLVMLLSLFFTGGGRYVSIDYWLAHFSSAEKAD